MSATKIQIGYGTGKPMSQKKGMYGKRRSGKLVNNGGFSFQPTVDFTRVDSDRWSSIFPNGYKPCWDR